MLQQHLNNECISFRLAVGIGCRLVSYVLYKPGPPAQSRPAGQHTCIPLTADSRCQVKGCSG